MNSAAEDRCSVVSTVHHANKMVRENDILLEFRWYTNVTHLVGEAPTFQRCKLMEPPVLGAQNRKRAQKTNFKTNAFSTKRLPQQTTRPTALTRLLLHLLLQFHVRRR